MAQLEAEHSGYLLEAPHSRYLLPAAQKGVAQTRGRIADIGVELEDLEQMEA